MKDPVRLMRKCDLNLTVVNLLEHFIDRKPRSRKLKKSLIYTEIYTSPIIKIIYLINLPDFSQDHCTSAAIFLKNSRKCDSTILTFLTKRNDNLE